MDIINIFSFCFCFNENNYLEGNAIIIDDNHDEYDNDDHNDDHDDYFHEIVIGIDFEYLYYEEFFNYIYNTITSITIFNNIIISR